MIYQPHIIFSNAKDFFFLLVIAKKQCKSLTSYSLYILPFSILYTMGSQLSDIYSSSVYEGGSSERFPYPIPDDSFMLDPPSSQRTLTSVTDTELIQPPPIPIALERVGPDRHKSFVLYTEISKDDFLH